MNLKELDGGIYDVEDLHKKYGHTIVYASTKLDPNPRAYYIQSLGHHVECQSTWGEEYKALSFGEFNLVDERPLPNVYNGINRPFMVVTRPLRQWKRGMHKENTSFVDIRGRFYCPEDKLLKEITLFYNPTYFSFNDAINMLANQTKKHVAIDKDTSILRAGNKFTLLKRFTPALTYQAGMVFKVNPINTLLKREVDYYEYLFKSSI